MISLSTFGGWQFKCNSYFLLLDLWMALKRAEIHGVNSEELYYSAVELFFDLAAVMKYNASNTHAANKNTFGIISSP